MIRDLRCDNNYYEYVRTYRLDFVFVRILRRWCCIEKFTRIQTITLTVIEGISSNDFVANRHNLPSLESLFAIKVDVVTPSSYEGDIVTDIVAISMIDNDRNSLLTSNTALINIKY